MAENEEKASVSPADQRLSVEKLDPIDSRSLNLPNLITLSRLLLAIVVFILIDIEGLWITAAVIFVVAASTDFLDGFIARRYGLVTTLGRILDPFVDKIIICGSFVFLLGKKEHIDSGVNDWMVIIIIAREMYVTSLRGFLEKYGHDFSAEWAGKVKMVFQCIAITVSLLSLSPIIRDSDYAPWFFYMRNILLWTTVAVTVISGMTYTYRAVIMLKADGNK